jgi:hypothetical protein
MSQIQTFNANPPILSKKPIYKKLSNLAAKQPSIITSKAIIAKIKYRLNPPHEYLLAIKIAKKPAETVKKVFVKPTSHPNRAIKTTLNIKKISINNIKLPLLLSRLQL